MRIARSKLLHDFEKAGAWPLLVRKVTRLLNCVNERDLYQLLDATLVLGHGVLMTSVVEMNAQAPWLRACREPNIYLLGLRILQVL